MNYIETSSDRTQRIAIVRKSTLLEMSTLMKSHKTSDALPPVTFPDIFTYLVCGVSTHTAGQFLNYKSLEAHVVGYMTWRFTSLVCMYIYLYLGYALPAT